MKYKKHTTDENKNYYGNRTYIVMWDVDQKDQYTENSPHKRVCKENETNQKGCQFFVDGGNFDAWIKNIFPFDDPFFSWTIPFVCIDKKSRSKESTYFVELFKKGPSYGHMITFSFPSYGRSSFSFFWALFLLLLLYSVLIISNLIIFLYYYIIIIISFEPRSISKFSVFGCIF